MTAGAVEHWLKSLSGVEVGAALGRFAAILPFICALGVVLVLGCAVLGFYLLGRAARSGAEEEKPKTPPADAGRERLLGLIEGMSQALLALDAGRQVALANSAARTLLGDKVDPLGRTLPELLRGPPVLRLLDAISLGRPAEEELEIEADKRRTVLVRAAPLKAGGTVLVLDDVTQLRRLETIRRDFVGNVSHELRTPVSIIQANAETLLAGAADDPEHRDAFLQAVLRNAERLSHIIEDLLELSRIEDQRVPMEVEPTPLEPIIQGVLDSVADLARHKSIEIDSDLEPELVVMAAGGSLERLLVNLVDNALKYGFEDGRACVRAARDGDAVRIEVEDDGPGIEPHHRARVFERFYRVDTGRSREMGGTGLGLAIVKHLAESMGGEVGVDAAEPRGCLFWVRLRSG